MVKHLFHSHPKNYMNHNELEYLKLLSLIIIITHIHSKNDDFGGFFFHIAVFFPFKFSLFLAINKIKHLVYMYIENI